MKPLQENIKNLLTWVLVIIILEITPKAQATNFFKVRLHQTKKASAQRKKLSTKWKDNEQNRRKKVFTYHCQGGENSSFYPSWVLAAALIIKLTQNRLSGEKEINFIYVHAGLIEIEPKKWPKQAAFIVLF